MAVLGPEPCPNSSRLRSYNRHVRDVRSGILFSTTVAVLVVASAACTGAQEVAALCRLVPSLESSLVSVRAQLEDLSSTAPATLESAVTGLIATLQDLNEFPPSEAADDLAVLLRAYEELAVTLRNVYWDGSLGGTDPAVSGSIVNLGRSDNVAALAGLRAYVERECQTTLPGPVGAPAIDATTLPPPPPVVEPMDEGDQIYDAEASRLRSYGYLIAESLGMAITSEQALCVGRWVGESVEDLDVDFDRVYQEAVQNAMQACVFSPATTVVREQSPQIDNG